MKIFMASQRVTTVVAAGMILAVLVLYPGAAISSEGVSGRLVNGFRVLSEADLAESADIRVFRGDYIRFDLGEKTSGLFSVPDLDIEATLVPDGDVPFFKMKREGRFGYVLGPFKGILQVVEYTQAHYQALTALGAKAVIENLNPLILDVRTPAEFRIARIEGGKLLPVQVLQQNLDRVSAYKEEPVLIYCATGNRSTVASKILIDNGFKRIFNLEKGIKDWMQQGLPIVNSSP